MPSSLSSESRAAGSGSDDDSVSSPRLERDGSESDSLDSTASRKKRRLSDSAKPARDLTIPSSSFSAPSRVRRRNLEPGAAADPAPPAPAPAPSAGVSSPGGVTVAVDRSTSFDALGLRPWLVQSLGNMKIRNPTDVQRLTIPPILEGRDVIGTSRTGSGKTVAFTAPILQLLAQDPSSVYAVVLTATRELALQIHQQVQAIGSPRTLKAALVTGGADMVSQTIALAQRPHVVVATPGRLADHIRQSGEDAVAGLRRARFLVLDEADRLLAAGGPGSMLPDIEEVLAVLPPSRERQTLLYTATITPEVRALKDMPPKAGKQPAYVCEVDAQRLAVPATLRQMYIQVNVTHKEYYLHTFLLTDGNVDRSIIIFCNRTSTAQYLHHLLRLLDHRVTSLHSKLPQRDRVSNLERFRAAAARLLVATDVASRGLDIPEVSLVVNYDLPQSPDDYIHRAGRTARAGRRGDCVSLVGQRDVARVLAVEARVSGGGVGGGGAGGGGAGGGGGGSGGGRMEAWQEDGVNLETRLVRDHLRLVAEKKREALLDIEEHREVGGKRKRTKLRMG
ncbi:DEAD-domain-containing protein [Xylariaceae sp. FL0804]|nr:DEAD-domain-containing protein [Xylariaceae sp. FL0804]